VILIAFLRTLFLLWYTSLAPTRNDLYLYKDLFYRPDARPPTPQKVVPYVRISKSLSPIIGELLLRCGLCERLHGLAGDQLPACLRDVLQICRVLLGYEALLIVGLRVYYDVVGGLCLLRLVREVEEGGLVGLQLH
jgi:hypothetical protein